MPQLIQVLGLNNSSNQRSRGFTLSLSLGETCSIRSMRHLGTHKGAYLAMSEYEAGSIGSRTSSGTDEFNIRAYVTVSAQLTTQTSILEVGK